MWTEILSVKWLDSQEPCSVIYGFVGSVSVMFIGEFLELAWGLEARMEPFLWVIHSNLIHGQSVVLTSEFMEKVKDICHRQVYL